MFDAKQQRWPSGPLVQGGSANQAATSDIAAGLSDTTRDRWPGQPLSRDFRAAVSDAVASLSDTSDPWPSHPPVQGTEASAPAVARLPDAGGLATGGPTAAPHSGQSGPTPWSTPLPQGVRSTGPQIGKSS